MKFEEDNFDLLVRLSRLPVLLIDLDGFVLKYGKIETENILSSINDIVDDNGYIAPNNKEKFKALLRLSARNLSLLRSSVEIKNKRYSVESAIYNNVNRAKPLLVMYIYPSQDSNKKFRALNQITDLAYAVKKHQSLEKKLLTQAEELNKSKQRIEELINFDELTGLATRRLFYTTLEKSILRHNKAGASLGVLYCDIDGFKQVNDNFGHTVGDSLLKVIGTKLKKAVREKDLVSRFGGDEFVILIENIDQVAQLDNILQRIKQIFQVPIKVEKKITYTKISIGISLYPKDSKSMDELIKLADLALYRSKDIEGNSHTYFNELK